MKILQGKDLVGPILVVSGALESEASAVARARKLGVAHFVLHKPSSIGFYETWHVARRAEVG